MRGRRELRIAIEHLAEAIEHLATAIEKSVVRVYFSGVATPEAGVSVTPDEPTLAGSPDGGVGPSPQFGSATAITGTKEVDLGALRVGNLVDTMRHVSAARLASDTDLREVAKRIVDNELAGRGDWDGRSRAVSISWVEKGLRTAMTAFGMAFDEFVEASK